MPKTIAAFGEILWDMLPNGRTLGGAPFNFIYRVTELGQKGIIVSAIGEDVYGDEAFQTVKKRGLKTDYIQRKTDWSTGTVKIIFNEYQQPDYEIIPKVAYDYIEFTPILEELSKSVDCIYYGTLAQRSEVSHESLCRFLNFGNDHLDPVKFLDINLRKSCYTVETVTASLERADILKLNEEEAYEVASITKLNGSGLEEIARKLVEEYWLDHCIITLGERGAACFSKDKKCVYDPGYEVDVVDPCGSGDAFSAGFLCQLFEGQTVAEGIHLGNLLGAIVASQHGATVPISKKNVARLTTSNTDRNYHPEFEGYILKQK